MPCVIDLPARWINPSELEAAVQLPGQPYGQDVFEVEFRFPVGSMLMTNAAIHVLSLVNQLALTSRRVRLAFDEGEAGTMGYLNRAGFFDHLAGPIEVLPRGRLSLRLPSIEAETRVSWRSRGSTAAPRFPPGTRIAQDGCHENRCQSLRA